MIWEEELFPKQEALLITIRVVVGQWFSPTKSAKGLSLDESRLKRYSKPAKTLKKMPNLHEIFQAKEGCSL